DYDLTIVEGAEIGRVNGLSVSGDSGAVLPIVAEVTPAINKEMGSVIVTGIIQKRKEPWMQDEESMAKQSISNVSAIIKKYTGKDIKEIDIHIQFIGTEYSGVEGPSASIAVATAVISAIEKIPVNQNVAMTGSLSVKGDVLPIGGVTYKIEAAAKAGIRKVLIPKANVDDVLIEDRYRGMVEVIPVKTIEDVLTHALVTGQKEGYLTRIKNMALTAPAKILDSALPNPSV
ncbi:MAG: ATP-dependent protease LonB, partial [Methanomicrobiales archaeon]|nr:ATP-dependent protease LonB [Methanomicrobiales archaeon]